MTTEIAIIDDKIVSKMERLLAEKARIEQQRGTLKTQGCFYWNPSNRNSPVILVEAKLTDLIEIAAFLHDRYQRYHAMAQGLQVDKYEEWSWCGYGEDAWMHDITLCIKNLKNSEDYVLICDSIERLEEVLPEYLRKQKILEDIESELPF